jgi:hypothetical protein
MNVKIRLFALGKDCGSCNIVNENRNCCKEKRLLIEKSKSVIDQINVVGLP